MQLFILILHNSRHMDMVLAAFMEEGIGGGSLLDCEGVLQAMSHTSVEPPPIFGSLRQYLNPERGGINKMLISALSEEHIVRAKELVKEITGGLDKENTGIMITVPGVTVEGIK